MTATWTIDVRKVRRGRHVRYVAWALGRSVLGEYPTADEAQKAGALVLALNKLDAGHICTPADIDKVRRELAKEARCR